MCYDFFYFAKVHNFSHFFHLLVNVSGKLASVLNSHHPLRVRVRMQNRNFGTSRLKGHISLAWSVSFRQKASCYNWLYGSSWTEYVDARRHENNHEWRLAKSSGRKDGKKHKSVVSIWWLVYPEQLRTILNTKPVVALHLTAWCNRCNASARGKFTRSESSSVVLCESNAPTGRTCPVACDVTVTKQCQAALVCINCALFSTTGAESQQVGRRF